MNRATKIVLITAMLMILSAGVAVAATFTCTTTTCNGTSNNDQITGNILDQTFNAKAGNDIVRAGGGDDIVYGQTGNDRLTGEGGCETLNGGQGSDLLDNATGDNCNRALSNPSHETVDAVDNTFDGIITNDSRPDEILCDPGIDYYRADPIDTVNGNPVGGPGAVTAVCS